MVQRHDQEVAFYDLADARENAEVVSSQEITMWHRVVVQGMECIIRAARKLTAEFAVIMC